MRHSKERVRKYGEVFTPEWLVKKMCDEIGNDYFDVSHTFLEPSCGTGNFIVEILTRKMDSISSITKENKYKCFSIRVLSTIYGVELLHDNIIECRKRTFKLWKSLYGRVFVCGDEMAQIAKCIIKNNLIWGDFIKKINLKTNQSLSFIKYDWDKIQVSLSSYKMEDIQNSISFNIPSKIIGTCHYKDLPKCLM